MFELMLVANSAPRRKAIEFVEPLAAPELLDQGALANAPPSTAHNQTGRTSLPEFAQQLYLMRSSYKHGLPPMSMFSLDNPLLFQTQY
jgi:hypothetical protein